MPAYARRRMEPIPTGCLQDGVIQKDEFMQALFNTAPGQLNFFADRVRAFTGKGSRVVKEWMFEFLSCICAAIRSSSCCST